MLKVAIMLCSPPKYLFSIEIEISTIVIAEFFWNAKKNLVFYFGVGRHASFPQKPVVKG
jgi:hypothetical protein